MVGFKKSSGTKDWENEVVHREGPTLAYRAFAASIVAYITLALMILWHLLLPGYIITLDLPWSPNITPPNIYGFETDPIKLINLPYRSTLWLLSQIAPSDTIQKALLFAVFFFAGLGAHRLCPGKSEYGRYFAGILYTINPFVYTRFMVGHLGLLLAYATLPYTINSALKLLKEPSLKRSVELALLITLNLLLDIHYLFIVGLLLLFLTVFRVVEIGWRCVKLLPYLTSTALLYIALNLYWLVPYLTGSIGEPIIEAFSYQDLITFTSKTWGTGVNIFFSLAALYGFWRYPEGYIYVSQTLPAWWLLYILILWLTIHGYLIYSTYHPNEKWVSRGIALPAIVSLILAAGISSTYTAPIFQTLFNTIPFFSGMREPQKFLATLTLAYATLGGVGAGDISDKLRQHFKANRLKYIAIIASALILAVSPAYSYNQLFGSTGQIKTLNYPEEWYEAKKLLDSEKGNYRILILPWHLYMYQSWIGRITANPAPAFFNKPSISGENVEWGGIETQSRKPTQHYIQHILNHRAEVKNLGALLKPLNIKYIILLKEVDYSEYTFLDNQNDLKPILENTKLKLYLNTEDVAKIYQLKEPINTEDWNQLIQMANNGTLQKAYKPINYTQTSPTEIKVEAEAEGYIILTEPYDEGWRLNGEKPIAHLGLVNAFQLKQRGEYTIRYEKFNTLLLGYLASLTALIGCLTYLATSHQRRKERKATQPPQPYPSYSPSHTQQPTQPHRSPENSKPTQQPY
jgi:hypothetical protein